MWRCRVCSAVSRSNIEAYIGKRINAGHACARSPPRTTPPAPEGSRPANFANSAPPADHLGQSDCQDRSILTLHQYKARCHHARHCCACTCGSSRNTNGSVALSTRRELVASQCCMAWSNADGRPSLPSAAPLDPSDGCRALLPVPLHLMPIECKGRRCCAGRDLVR